MSKTRDAFGWPDLWALYDQLAKTNPGVSHDLAVALNAAGRFDEWLESRAPDVQTEVMSGAPAWVLVHAIPVMSSKAAQAVYKTLSERARDELRKELPGVFSG